MHHSKRIVEMAERSARKGATEDCLRQLRGLCLDEFALVLHGIPDERYPGLSSVLPAMASVDVQRDWTGAAGVPLLTLRVAFIEKIRRHFMQVTGRPLEGSRHPRLRLRLRHHASSDVLPHGSRTYRGLRSLG